MVIQSPDRAAQPGRTPRLKPLTAAVRALIASGLAGSAGFSVQAALPVPADFAPALSEPLPVPADAGLVAPGNGDVDRPTVAGKTMTIRQHSPKAVLDWKRFNIQREHKVEFNQATGPTAIALNRIHDSNPSQILGTLTANGQVFLINQNGFLFGKDARVDTNTFVASTLPIKQTNFEKGLTRVIQEDGEAFIGDESAPGSGQVYRTDEKGNKITDAAGNPLKREIRIEEGAKLTSQDGGRIMIFAPSITNKGDIETPNGQAIVAAATDKVYLQEADSAKTGVRGLLVEVQTGGDVTNLGRIAAKTGNVTVAGFAVNQSGRVSATTSVKLNGSIRLLAREGANVSEDTVNGQQVKVLRPSSTGRTEDQGDGLGKAAKLTLGQGSITEVVPDTDTAETAVDGQVQQQSRIEMSGKKVVLGESSLVSAPSGHVSIRATARPELAATDDAIADKDTSLDLRLGARIDVAGIKNVKVPVSRNVVEVELRSFELRDAPLQKPKDIQNPGDKILYAKKVFVDIRDAQDGRIPIADISGSEARIERGINERSTKGGKIELSSAGSLDIEKDATLDVSGGTVKYQGGKVRTTELGANGRFYEISKADPGLKYDSVRRGRSRFEEGYVEGKDAGSISLRSNQLRLDGNVVGRTVDGRYQRRSGERAKGSELSIDVGFQSALDESSSRQSVAILSALKSAEEQLAALLPRTPAGATETEEQAPAPLVLFDRLLLRSGLRQLNIRSNTRIAVAEKARLNLEAGGGVKLDGGEIDFRGKITAPSGTVSLETDTGRAPESLKIDGGIHLPKGSRIDVSGQWTNDLLEKTKNRPLLATAPVDGGSVAVKADGSVDFKKGSRIAADGGAWLTGDGKLTAGKGGSIALAAGFTEGKPSEDLPNNLTLDGKLHAFGMAQGGTLALTANQILVGSAFSNILPPVNNELPLILAPNLLNSGGFRDYRLTANRGDVRIGSDARVALQAKNYVLDDAYSRVPTGGTLEALSRPELLDIGLRQPVNLELAIEQKSDTTDFTPNSSIVLEPGSTISADPGAAISLQGRRQVRIEGTINAPAGTIAAGTAETAKYQNAAFLADQGIFLGPDARLLSRGAVVPTPGGLIGLRDDKVLPGGSVELHANRGYIVLTKGSLIDVSGADAVVDEIRANPGGAGSRIVPVVHASKAGSIELRTSEGAILDGKLAGRSRKDRGAEGGRLTVSVQKFLREPPQEQGPSNTFPAAPRAIELRQEQKTVLADTWEFGSAIDSKLNGLAQVSASQVQAGGFDSLTLNTQESTGTGNVDPTVPQQIRFVGDVNLRLGNSLTLDTPSIALLPAEGATRSGVTVDAAYLRLGSTEIRSGLPDPAAGPGRFTAIGRDIELVGGLRTEGIGQTALLSEGDLRLRGLLNRGATIELLDFQGEFKSFGPLTLKADQIYPATLSRFSIGLLGDDDARLTVLGGDRTGPVLSAGGGIAMTAPNITIAGTIKAPFGKIDLKATARDLTLTDGALVSVSAENQLLPFGTTQAAGLNWIYPLTRDPNTNQLLSSFLFGSDTNESAPPTGNVALTGAKVDVQAGATVDLSGGGDLYAHELVAGRGGSVDLLDPQDAGFVSGNFSFGEKYAVLPWLGERTAPFDPLETPKYTLAPGDSVYLANGAAGLAAGRYTLLPASYALLPGAYLVTLETGFANASPGTINRLSDGTPVVAGYRTVAGTGFRDYQWEGFSVESGAAFRRRTEYIETTGSSFFTAQAERLDKPAPSLSRDAGSLSIDVTRELSLAGTLRSAAADQGRGGRVAISAEQFRIAAQASAPTAPGQVVLEAGQISNLNAGSLLIGGVDTGDDEDGRHVAVRSKSVGIDSGVSLTAPELILTATDGIDVGAGAQLRGEGTGTGGTDTINLTGPAGAEGDTALLRVSSGGPVAIDREGTPSGSGGKLNIGQGATIAAAGSATLDATGAFGFAGNFDIQPGKDGSTTSLSIGAPKINLGDVPATAAGLALTAGQLSTFKGDELILRSDGDLTAYGNVALAASKRLSIEAQGISADAVASGVLDLKAGTVEFSNPGTPGAGTGSTGTGSLRIAADQLLDFGGGTFALNGFQTIALSAGDTFKVDKQGSLLAGGDVTLTAPQWLAGSGADFSLKSPGHAFALVNAAKPASPLGILQGNGAKIDIAAGSVSLDSAVHLPAGIFNVTSESAIGLGANADLDLQGYSTNFAGTPAATAGGSLSLSALAGDVDFAGGKINLSAIDRAGTLDVSAPAGTIRWRGALTATGGVSDGALAFDAGSLSSEDLTALLSQGQSLSKAAGFDLRLRSGDLSLAAGQTYKAHEISLSADQGNLDVGATLDASGTTAGSITLAAGDQVNLAGGARLLAGTATDNAKGGQIFIESVDRDGDNLSGITVADGVQMDVRGGAVNNPAATPNADQIRNITDGPTVDGDDGKQYLAGDIHLRALREVGDNGALGIRLGNAATNGAEQVTAEAVKVYDASAIDVAQIGQWRDETRAYMDGLKADDHPGLTVVPGLEVRSSGDLTLASDWSFATASVAAVDGSGAIVDRYATGEKDENDNPVTAPIPLDAYGAPDIVDHGNQDPNDPNAVVFLKGVDNSDLKLAPGPTQRPIWQYGSDRTLPGYLTLRAAGNLNIQQDLSDGVAPGFLGSGPDATTPPPIVPEMIQPGASWSFRLVAGADAGAADSTRTQAGSGDISIASGARVRTGSSDIGLFAGRDLGLQDETSAIYTVGQVDADQSTRFGSFGESGAARFFPVDYPTAGGDITVAAGRDINGATTRQFVPDWLIRTGNWAIDTGSGVLGTSPVAWGISLSQAATFNSSNIDNTRFYIDPGYRGFRQNIGALAGGNVAIRAKGDIRDLSAVVPTIGKPVGEANSDDNGSAFTTVKNNRIDVHGGGNLAVWAGGNIAGGSFYVEKGAATLGAGGAVSGGRQFTSGALFYLGDGTIDLTARLDAEIGAVVNPFLFAERANVDVEGTSNPVETGGVGNMFSTYSGSSRFSVTSVGGNVGLQTDVETILLSAGYPASSTDDIPPKDANLTMYPGSLTVHSFSGSIGLARYLSLAPNSGGTLSLFAEDSIIGGRKDENGSDKKALLQMSDADPTSIPSPLAPANDLFNFKGFVKEFGAPNPDAASLHAPVPVHENDGNPVRIATRQGDIFAAFDSNFSFVLPKTSIVSAGRDILNISFDLQNLQSGDVSRISAGRDIRFLTNRDPGGVPKQNPAGIALAGPGELQILAGRNIDLGNADGVVTTGNTANPALPKGGADINVLAGLSAGLTMNTGDFLKAYSSLDDAAIDDLSPARQLSEALPLLFDEIRKAGIKAAKSGSKKDYEGADKAIALLFSAPGDNPGDPPKKVDNYSGDLSLFFSRLQTLSDGNVRMLTPGGSVNAGITNANLGNSKQPDKLGIVIQQRGSIEAMVGVDFNVNESRVFALGGQDPKQAGSRISGQAAASASGDREAATAVADACKKLNRCAGDITVWSTNGDIDAGRGAKSALAVPPVQSKTDNDGNTTLIFPPIVSGSGIGTSSSDPKRPAGDIYLFAPRGVVDAGEAGIRGNNITIAATAVLGANNISASGTSVGVPTTPAAPVIPGAASNAASAAAQQADQQATQAAGGNKDLAKDAAKQAAAALTPIQVDLLGFGNCSLSDVREGKPGCGT